MLIIKKSGNVEEFNSHKLMSSIANAAEDAKIPLNEGDINFLSKEILKKVTSLRENKTSSFEVLAITVEILKENGFKSVAREYVNYSINE